MRRNLKKPLHGVASPYYMAAATFNSAMRHSDEIEKFIAQKILPYSTGREWDRSSIGNVPEYDWIDNKGDKWELKCSSREDIFLEICSKKTPSNPNYKSKTITYNDSIMYKSAFGLCEAKFVVFLTLQNRRGKLRIFNKIDLENWWMDQYKNNIFMINPYGDKYGYEFSPRDFDENNTIKNYWGGDFSTIKLNNKDSFNLNKPIRLPGIENPLGYPTNKSVGLRIMFESFAK